MAFINYKTSNNAETTLLGDISASSTNIIVQSSEGDIFPASFPYLLTLEKFNASSQVIKREIVKVTGKTGDTFTITRAEESCVQDDTASPKTITNNALSFNSGDKVSLYNTSGNDKDLKDELVRLETDKANDSEVIHNTGDETGITGNKTFTGNITANAFIGDGSGLTGISSVVEATQSTAIAGEDGDAGDALYRDTTTGNVFKTDASDSNKINFIGFANSSFTTGNPVTFNTSGVDSNQTGLIAGSDYYLGASYSSYNQEINVTGTVGANYGFGLTTLYGNTFTPSTNIDIGKITPYIQYQSGYGGPIYCNIYATSGGLPTGASLGTASIQGISNTSYEYKDFNFPNIISLTSGTTYAFVLSSPSSSSTSTYSFGAASSDVYAGGNIISSTNSGSSYTATTTRDIFFDVYSGIGVKNIGPIPGANSVKVGKAISATEILIDTERNDLLEGATSTTATTGAVTLGNAVGYITVKINGTDRKIPYYSV